MAKIAAGSSGPAAVSRSWPDMLPSGRPDLVPAIKERSLAYKTSYQRLYHIRAAFQDHTKDYFVNEWDTRAGLVVDREGKVLLVSQYRLLIDGPAWEIPGGSVDEGETPSEAAQRECLEEAGVLCAAVEPLLFYHLGLDTAYNPTHLFWCASSVDASEQWQPNAQEVSARAWIPLGRCLQMIRDGQIIDSFTILALLAYHVFRGTSAP